MNKEVVNDKSVLFALNETTMHELRVSPNSEQIMKVWVKEPTWLQVEQALSSVMDLNQQTQSMNLDLNKMYRELYRENRAFSQYFRTLEIKSLYW